MTSDSTGSVGIRIRISKISLSHQVIVIKMDSPVHILLVEDDPAHAELIQRAFEDRGNAAKLTIASTLEEARAHLRAFKPTLIIADWRLPDGESGELLPEDHLTSTPIIIMTSYGNERNAVNVMKSGALDYIV